MPARFWRLPLTMMIALQTLPAGAAVFDSAAGKAAFAPCSTCHATTKGVTGIGPNLVGVVGRTPGSVPGFAYSAAMKAKGGVWDTAALDAFLANPQKAVPGNRMPFPGQPDAAKRALIIGYLKTLK